MKLIERIEDLGTDSRGGALGIGNFDGVHKGHARIVARICSLAREVGGPAVIFTFDPHPVRILRPNQAPPPLTWTRRKAELLAELGIEVLVAYPTDAGLLQLSPKEFFNRVVIELLGARALVEGPNFFFGQGRSGNVETLRALCRDRNMPMEVVPLWQSDGRLVSSSRVRNAIQQGDVESANQMLTRPYRLRGLVVHGARRGVTLGFPTANLDAIDTLIPAAGVYAGRGWFCGESYAAAIHVGPVPTFRETHGRVEVHLIDVNQNIYGETLEVDFLGRLRDVRPFESTDALRKQLATDVAAAREVAAWNPGETRKED